MDTEIELKFFVSPAFSQSLHEKIATTKVCQHSCKELINQYFDTPCHWLRAHDIGLRIRKIGDAQVQTIKTAGRVVGGLHQRPEYNAEIKSPTPDLSLHPADIWPENTQLDEIQAQLYPIFSTNFIREQWLVSMPDGSQVEVAFDQGMVCAGDKQEPICEIELELKSGQTEALFSLARLLCSNGGMRLGNISKAQRGYELAYGKVPDLMKELILVNTQKHDSVEKCFIQSLEHGLLHWQYHEQIYTQSGNLDALNEIRFSVNFIRQVLAVYNDIVPRRASALIRQELKWLSQELDWLKLHDHYQYLLEDKGHVLRKLDARKWLVSELQKMDQALPTFSDNLKLLTSGRYTNLVLDLSRWIVTRGWQLFLDDKAQQKMSQSVAPFSVDQLDYTWSELKNAFPDTETLSKDVYVAEQYRLMRNLCTGICFANLYDAEERTRFRLPWTDLVQGIDDLLMLIPLEHLVTKLEDKDEQQQVQRWIKRQEESILRAMDQTRLISVEAKPYWLE